MTVWSRARGLPWNRPQSTTTDRQLDLDVVRGAAIVLAMGWHLNGATSNNPVYNALMAPGRTFGWAGVDLFFVLSGFLVGRLLMTELSRSGSIDGRRFLVRRAFKLWPVLYMFLIVQLIIGDTDWRQFLWQTSLHIQNYTHGAIAHLWSLAVEEHFYLLLTVALTWMSASSLKPKCLLALLSSIAVACLAARSIARIIFDVNEINLQVYTHFRVDSLSAGFLLALIYVYYPKLWTRLVTLRPLWILALSAGIVWLCLVPKNTDLGSTAGYTVAYLTGSAALLAAYDAPIIIRFPSAWRPLAKLGIFSYAIYIWHIAAANFGVLVQSRFTPSVTNAEVTTFIRYASAILVAVAITKVVEWPALKIRDRLYPSRVSSTERNQ